MLSRGCLGQATLRYTLVSLEVSASRGVLGAKRLVGKGRLEARGEGLVTTNEDQVTQNCNRGGPSGSVPLFYTLK